MTKTSTVLSLAVAAAIGFAALWQLGVFDADAAKSSNDRTVTVPSDKVSTLVNDIVDQMSDEQKEQLADEIVTQDEYVAATDAAAECVRAIDVEGLAIQGPAWQGDRYEYTATSSGRDSYQSVMPELDRCEFEHRRGVARVWEHWVLEQN